MTNFVTIEGRALKQAMRMITDIIERRNTIPILGCARLQLDADGLKVTGTDLDIEATVDLDVISGAGEWAICIDASVLSGIASAAGVMPMRIEPNGDKAVIKLDGDLATYEIQALPASDFPEMSEKRGKLIETFTNGMLASTLDKVRWCISTEETRYYLNGVAWQTNEDGCRFVATDGHRLALCRYSSEEDEPSSRIIPRKTVHIIAKHMAGKDVAIFSTDRETTIDIAMPGASVRTKLIDGAFPDVDRVIPKENKHSFVFQKAEILAAIDRVSAIRGQKGRAIKFAPKQGRVSIECRNPDFGDATAITATQWADKKATEFGFNSSYIREIADACQGEITLTMTDSVSPFAVTDADETMTRVLMPMRV